MCAHEHIYVSLWYASLNGLWFSKGLLHMLVAGFLALCVASDLARGPLGFRILSWLLVG